MFCHFSGKMIQTWCIWWESSWNSLSRDGNCIIEPEKFRPQYKVHNIFRVKGKNWGRSGFRKQQFFRPKISTRM